MPDDELTDDPTIPVLDVEDEAEKPPPIEPTPVEGAEGLPDDVKNGDAEPEGETHPSVDHEPIVESRDG